MSKIFNNIHSSLKSQTVIVWLLIFVVLLMQLSWLNVRMSLLLASVTIACMMAVYYPTQMMLRYPKLVYNKSKILYAICSIILIASFTKACHSVSIFIIDYFEVRITVMDKESMLAAIMFQYLVYFILTYTISNLVFFFKKTSDDNRQKEKLEYEKKMLEVKILKSQINSHFLFNALNNIYSMIYFKDEYTSGYVLKLAQMMRYVMEDCEAEFTPLAKEIEYVENFIDFQKLRYENNKDIVFSYDPGNGVHAVIPPMIIQPFVENCFKYTSLDVDRNSYIHISIKIEGAQIHFVAENSQPVIKNKSIKERIGIGIENVKKRLELHYATNFILNISDNTDTFKVELIINLEPQK